MGLNNIDKIRSANARIKELEGEISTLSADLAAANATIADLRDADKRAVKIAAEECNRQKAEFEKQLADYEKAIDIDEAHLAKYRAENAKLICEVGDLKARAEAAEAKRDAWFNRCQEVMAQLGDESYLCMKLKLDAAEARLAEAEARIQNVNFLNDEMNGRLGGLLEAYEEVVAGNQALLRRAEVAEGNAKVLAERLIESGEWLEAAEARAEAVIAELKKRNEYVEALEHDVGVLLARASAAERDYKAIREFFDANPRALGSKLLAAEADAQRYRAALEKVEWGGMGQCQWCLSVHTVGHKPDCARQAALSHGEGEGGRGGEEMNFDQAMKAYYKERDALGIGRQSKETSEQEFIERIISGDLNAMLYNLDLCIQEQTEEDAQQPAAGE